jgi:cold shock CspA family protein
VSWAFLNLLLRLLVIFEPLSTYRAAQFYSQPGPPCHQKPNIKLKLNIKLKTVPKKDSASRKKPALNKERALAQIVALTSDDDERTAMSKKISWILRKGAERIALPVNDGWVKLADILTCDLLEDMSDRTEARLMSIVKDSNEQKLRYEIKETSDGVLLRALSKAERKKPEDTPAPAEKSEKTTSELRGDAPAFVPKAEAAATPMSPTAGYGYPSFGYPGFMPYGYPWPYGGYPSVPTPAAATPAADPSSTRFQGRIKSFNAEKGYGFIESAEAFQYYGRDVFLHKALIGDLAVGAVVSFTVESNKEGFPQARDITGSGSGGGKGSKGKGKDSKGKGKGKEGKEGKGSKDKDDKKEKGKGKKDKKENSGKSEDKKEKAEAETGEVSTDASPAPAAPEATPAETAPADAAEAQKS